MKSLSNNQKIVLIFLIIGILLTGLFGVRTFRSIMHMRQRPQPLSTDVEVIKGWMTIPYISHVYAVPESYLFQQLGIPPNGNDKNSLDRLDTLYFSGQTGTALVKTKAAVSFFQTTHPTPGGHK